MEPTPDADEPNAVEGDEADQPAPEVTDTAERPDGPEGDSDAPLNREERRRLKFKRGRHPTWDDATHPRH